MFRNCENACSKKEIGDQSQRGEVHSRWQHPAGGTRHFLAGHLLGLVERLVHTCDDQILEQLEIIGVDGIRLNLDTRDALRTTRGDFDHPATCFGRHAF